MKTLIANLRALRCLLFKPRVVPIPILPAFSRSTLAVRRSSRLRPAAFTLVELLVVISIISILLGLLYGAIRTVGRYSRETITRGELCNIEAAWKKYYDYYRVWPTNDVENVSPSTRIQDSSGDMRYEIGPVLARMLAGASTNATGFPPLNPDSVPFIEFTRFDPSAAPINAWGEARGQRYVVKFDVNGDNVLAIPIDTSGASTNIFRPVAVWTVNPDRPGTLLGSWMQ